MSRYARIAGHAGLWVFVGSAAVFGAMPAAKALGFSHRTHPLAWLGATGVPNALYFNLLGFALAGLLAAVALWPLRTVLPKDVHTSVRWSARIGAQLVMLSALAFAAQGLLPIDLDDVDGNASGLHGMAWMSWLLMFSAGNALLAWGLRNLRVAPAFLIAQIVPCCALFAQMAMPPAIAQRLAFVVWFVWVAWFAGRYDRMRAAG